MSNVPPPAEPAAPAPAAAPKQGLSLTSFIVGIAGLVILSWVAILGFLVGLAAVILGFIAKGKEPAAPKWMWIVGLITGFVTIAINLVVSIGWILLFATAASLGGVGLY